MSSHYHIDGSILRNIGQAWNFFALLSCSNMRIHENSSVQGVITGKLPDGRYIRYMEILNESECSRVKKELRDLYNSSTQYLLS